jgi:type 1 fimbria pilin
VTRRLFVAVLLLLVCAATVTPPSAAAQAPEHSSPSSASKPVDVSGKWQVSWQGRLGTEQCTLQLQQDGTKLTGTFQDVHGLSSLAGSAEEKRISFDVQFQGPRPFTTRFTGTTDPTVDPGKIEGTSQAVGVGGAGAYLGHAGEVVQPEHPWTAKRIPNQPSETGSNPTPPARN